MRARLFGSRKRKVATLALLALLALGGTALAAWLISGTQHYGAKGATLSPPIFTPVAATVGAYPTGTPTGSLNATVSNPNPVALHVTVVASSPTVTFSDGSPGPCLGSNFSVSQAAVTAFFNPGASGFTVAANAVATPVVIPNSVILATNAPDTCQGTTTQADWNGGSLTWST